MERIARPLTADQLASIREATEAVHDAESSGAAFLAVWRVILAGEGLTFADFGDTHKLDPRAFALPADQSADIMRAILDRMPERDRESFMLTWTNGGPSTYDPPRI